MALRHITKISDLSRAEITSVLSLALDMKANQSAYHDALKRKTLLMLFEKPVSARGGRVRPSPRPCITGALQPLTPHSPSHVHTHPSPSAPASRSRLE